MIVSAARLTFKPEPGLLIRMGTRQELGLLLLVLLLALPALWQGGAADTKPAASDACARPVELSTGTNQVKLICLAPGDPAASLRPLARALPSDCPAPKGVRPGTRITVERAVDGRCALEQAPMPAMRKILLGLKLDPNLATESDLEVLPGIGPALAKRIAIELATNGPFDSVEDLLRVKGIGPKTLERIRPFLAL